MSPRELLGVVVRTAGLGCLLIAAFDLYHLVGKLARSIRDGARVGDVESVCGC
jgi:hypothetical protein